jgi:hypothetical protein
MKPTSDIRSRIRQLFKTLGPTAGLIAAAVFLNALMNAGLTPAENQVSHLLLVSPEIFVIFILLGLAALIRIPYHRGVFLVLTLAVIFLRLFRLADSLVPAYFFRPFNLYLDSQLLPDLIFLLYSTVRLKTFILGSMLTVLAFGLAAVGIFFALKTIYAFLTNRSRRFIFLAAVALLGTLIYSPQPWIKGQAAFVFAPGRLHRVAAEFDFILHLSDTTQKHQAALNEVVHKGRAYPQPLAKLNGSDVYVFFIESYGHTVFADRRHSPLITPYLEDTERKLLKYGYLACSNFLKSPAFGGSSWLAHGELASGVTISSQLKYDLLMTSAVEPIAGYFNRAGYRTVSVMPGTLWPWPAGKYYQYRETYYAPDFDYKGPKFGWAPMTDQYVLDAVYKSEILKRTAPLFIEFVLISSHAPFNEMPGYIDDWSTIGDGSIYHDQEPVRFPIIWPDLENASEAYVSSIKYDWQVLLGFMEQTAANDQIIIILGDHQPNLKITGENQPWSVPVHIISRNPDFISPFTGRGYTPGLVPAQPLPHAGIDSLLWLLLEEFS